VNRIRPPISSGDTGGPSSSTRPSTSTFKDSSARSSPLPSSILPGQSAAAYLGSGSQHQRTARSLPRACRTRERPCHSSSLPTPAQRDRPRVRLRSDRNPLHTAPPSRPGLPKRKKRVQRNPFDAKITLSPPTTAGATAAHRSVSFANAPIQHVHPAGLDGELRQRVDDLAATGGRLSA